MKSGRIAVRTGGTRHLAMIDNGRGLAWATVIVATLLQYGHSDRGWCHPEAWMLSGGYTSHEAVCVGVNHTETPFVTLYSGSGPYGYYGRDWKHLRNGSGPVTLNAVAAGAFFNDRGSSPRMQRLSLSAVYPGKDQPNQRTSHDITLSPCMARTMPRGSVWLASDEPKKQPLVNANYTAQPEDMRLSIGGIRGARKTPTTGWPCSMIAEEIFPDPNIRTDGELTGHARRGVEIVCYPAGNCNTNRSDGEGIRIADISAIPASSVATPMLRCSWWLTGPPNSFTGRHRRPPAGSLVTTIV